LRSSLAGRSIPPPVDHSSFQPFPDLLPGGERPDQAEKIIVVDSVKCGFQVRVKYPYPVSLLEAYRVVDSRLFEVNRDGVAA
jgi:hypothetical protein